MLKNNKKGFTLVELMIVLVFMGLGAFALANLMSMTNRVFAKTEERYKKTEEVKYVVEMLDTIKIGNSGQMEIYDTLDVVPKMPSEYDANKFYGDTVYSYLYVKGNEIDTNNDGVMDTIDGYNLYYLPASAQPSDAIRLNQLDPLYFSFRAGTVYDKKSDESDDEYAARIANFEKMWPDEKRYDRFGNEVGEYIGARNTGELCINVAAIDGEFEYGRLSELSVPTERDYYFSLEPGYHFPNIYESTDFGTVNSNGGARAYSPKILSSGTITDEKVTSVDSNGIVLKFAVPAGATPVSEFDVAINTFHCFIATASYGKGEGVVGLLCDFRDNCLLTNAPGRAFVKAYYAVSPDIARFISKSEPLKAAVRFMLKPVVVVAELSLNNELVKYAIPFLLIMVMLLAFAVFEVIKYGKRRKKRKD